MSPRTELIIKNNELDNTEDEKINIESKQYNDLLKIYEIAMHQVADTLNSIKERLNNMYGYTIIEKIDSRVKSKKSIMNKIKKKGTFFQQFIYLFTLQTEQIHPLLSSSPTLTNPSPP